MRLLRVIIFLLLVAFLGLAGYAYFGDMGADQQPMRIPVQLDLNNATSPSPAAPSSPAAQPATAGGGAAAIPEATPEGGSDANLD